MMRITKVFFLFFIILSTCGIFNPAWSDNNKPLIVAVCAPYAPFIDVVNGQPQGLLIDLWEKMAATHHWQYSYIVLDKNVDQHMLELANHQYDVLLAPTSLDESLINKIQYSIPYFINTVNILSEEQSVDFKALFVHMLNSYLLKISLIYALFFIVYLHVVWFTEHYFYKPTRDYNGEAPVPKSYLAGIWWLFYYHMTLDNHFFNAKKTGFSRISYAVYFYTSFIFLTIIGASATSALTVSLSSSTVAFSEVGLESHHFAYVKGQGFYKELSLKDDIPTTPVSTIDEGVALLNQHRVEGIINSNALLYQYLTNHNPQKKLVISPFSLSYIFYYIAVAPNTPILAQMNRDIITLQKSKEEAKICKKYNIPNIKYCSFY